MTHVDVVRRTGKHREVSSRKATFLRLAVSLLLWTSPVSLRAQDAAAPAQASLTIVNAVPGDKNLYVNFDGQSIWPPGFTPGQSTAAVFFPAGKKALKIECEGYATTEAKMEMLAGASCAMIFYPGELVADGPDKGKRRIGVFLPAPHLLGAKAPQGKRWKAILVGTSESQEVEINGKKLVLTPRKSTEFSAEGGLILLKHKGKDIFGTAPEEAGEYWVVVFPGEESLQAVVLNHSPMPLP